MCMQNIRGSELPKHLAFGANLGFPSLKALECSFECSPSDLNEALYGGTFC